MLSLLVLSTTASFAQSGIILSWDSEVGCLEYSYDKDREQPIEDLGDDDCLLVCEGSTVSFTIDAGTQPVTSISWTTDGGQVVLLSNGDATADITWPIAYPNGNVSVHIILADGQEYDASICVTVKPKPNAYFEILGQQSQYFCSDVELIFDNQSYMPDGSQIIASVWDFGDGTYSNEADPTHSYANTGYYTITLTVYDECGCSAAWRTNISVTKPGIVMDCPSVVCEGAMETYTLEGPAYQNGDVTCGTYQWAVEGGHLLSQGQDWVQVIWDSVDPSGFGYVYFDQSSCNVTCNNMLVVEIPIIAAHGTLTGATEICHSDQARYALPQWPSTAVNWAVTPVGNPGAIVPDAIILVDQRNEVAVDASVLPSGDYILHADYTNTLIQCSGEADFQFTVLEDLEIDENQIEAEICQGNTAGFSLTQTIPGVTWTITLSGQTVTTLSGSGSGSGASYQFTAPGHYTLSATANGYCTDYAAIDVVEIPSVANAEILGALEICPTQAEIYTFDGETGGFDVYWYVDHGSFLGPNVGENVTVKFDAGYTDYEVSAQLINPNFQSCASDLVILPVALFVPQAQLIQTTGYPNAICASSVESFELQGYSGMDYYEWTIEPAELAHVSAGDGSENVNILFNEPYQGQTQGTITVSAKVCGVMTALDQVNFELNENPVLTVTSAPSAVCANEAFTIQVSSNPPIPASAFSINFDASLVSYPIQAVTVGSGLYEFQNIGLTNADPDQTVNVSYTITASGPGLCSQSQISGTLNRYPAPVVAASFTGGNLFCPPEPITTVLTATVQGTGTQQSTIQWMYGGSVIGSGATLDLATVSSAGYGDYTAVATNAAGCQTVSEAVEIHQNCGSGLPACSGESVVLTEEWTDCNRITLTATFTGNPSSTQFLPSAGFTVHHIEPLTPVTTGNTYTQEFETDASGTYIFGFLANYTTCVVTGSTQVDVEYKALLAKQVACDANGYLVTILNQSTRMPGSNPNVDYTFAQNPGGQTTPPLSQDDNEATAALGNGSYTLTLTLSSTGKPTCEVAKGIELQLPDASFTLLADPVCAETPVVLSPDISTPDASYLWGYQGASNTLENITPTLAGTDEDGAEITLTVTDAYGCSSSFSDSIVVFEPDFIGDIFVSPSNDICPGQTVDLTYQTTFGNPPVAYQWLRNLLEIGGATNSTLTGASQSGEYAVYLYDDFGCRDATISSAFINYIQPPHLSAEITASVCDGASISLSGTLTPANTEFQIWRSTNSNPYILVQGWTAGPSIAFVDATPGVGSYTYKVEYKDPLTECATEQYFDAVVHPTPEVTVQLDNVVCAPYTLQLTANGNQQGTYIWSNGMSGATITVNHGGPYWVKFRPDGADCVAMETYIAPKSPDVYSWIFPTGCFTYCKGHLNHPYLVGPIPYFAGGYAYLLDGTPVASSGQGVVPDLVFANNMDGNLTLTLESAYCAFTTDTLEVYQQGCNHCNIEFKISQVLKIIDPAGFVYYQILTGYIDNPYGFPITVHLSSPQGGYSPAIVNIAAGSTFFFASSPVYFIPYSPLQGPVITGYEVTKNQGSEEKIVCKDYFSTDFIQISALQTGTGNSNPVFAKMSVMPNPIATDTEVKYEVINLPEFTGGAIRLYSLDGRLIATQQVIETRGRVRFDLSRLASGTYVVVFANESHRLGQHVLIKR